MPTTEVSRILDRWTEGDTRALGDLMPLVVADLRNIARRHLAQEQAGHTLQPTALVNEVYLRLVGKRTVTWRNRAQFFAFVAGMMRRVLVDHARGRRTVKRGRDHIRVSFDDLGSSIPTGKSAHNPDLLDLHEALQHLAKIDQRQCRIVELRYFTGLSVKEIAEVEGVSATTVKREWRTARLWLCDKLADR